MKTYHIKKNYILYCLALAFVSVTVFACTFAEAAPVEPKNNPDDYLSVEFIDAPLAEIVVLIAEYSGQSFVVSSQEEIVLSWVEKDIFKEDLLKSFAKVIAGAGLTLQKAPGKRDLYIIKQTASYSANTEGSLGFYLLKNIDSKSLEDSAEILFGKALAIKPLEETKVVLFSGSPEMVNKFMTLLPKIDIPLENDIEAIRLKHISVKSAIKALTDTKLIADNTFFPDYWNRSVLIKGSHYERNVALATIKAIDKPQTGWIDQLEYVHTIQAESVTEVLTSACPEAEIRKLADDRILISGLESDVEKASVLLHKIDGAGMQVKVEAVIAYLTDREFQELGIKLNYTDAKNNYRLNDNLIDTLITQNTGLLLQYFNDFLGVSLAAEKGNSHGEILSSPVLTVLNGQTAKIHVGQNVPYLSKANYDQNDGTSTGTSIERKDIGITFTVTPAIEPDGEFVHLQVSQEVSNINDDSELSQDVVDVIVDKKEISSTVMVADGDTIFLGGLRSEENGRAKDFIPLLGELPLVGKLFSYDVEQKENRHLIVSLRVNVIGRS